MAPIVARRSVKHHTRSVLWGGVFFVVVHLLGMPLTYNIPISLVIMLGPELLKLSRAVVNQDEVLRIDESGILDHRQGFHPIPWNQIESMKSSRGRLRLRIRDPDALNLPRTIWRRLNQPLFKEPWYYVQVNLSGLDVPVNEIVSAVQEYASQMNAGSEPG